jgi:methyl-accepting chemotaxis protein
MHSQHIGKEMYQIIADTVINRDLAESERDWLVCKQDSLELLRKVDEAVENPQEKADVREAGLAIIDIIRIYEQEMLPLIRAGATVAGPLALADAELDKRITAIDQALLRVAHSLSEKNRQAEWMYNRVL